MAGAQTNGGGCEIETPSGRLFVSPDLSFRGLIRASVRSHEKVLAAVEAASRLSSPVFLQCGGFRHDTDGFHLTWPAVRGEPKGLLDLVAQWRGYPAVHIPQVLDLGNFVYRASSELCHLRPLRFLFSPPQICRLTGESGQQQWMIVPLPLEGAGVSDFVAASELSTVWLSGDELLGIGSTDRCFLLGAVLYYCLVSDLFPHDVSHGERFRRCLSFRAGNLATARTTIQSSVPKALAAVATQLAEFICALLAPSYGRAISPAQAVVELERFQMEFAPPRLASLWEAEGHNPRAVAILNAFALSANKSEVPWQALARLRKVTGDAVGAVQALANVVQSPEQRKAVFISKTHSAGRSGSEGRAEVERAVAKLSETGTSTMDPEEFLFLAYMNARFLERFDESIQLLRREFTVSWHKVIAGVLAARFAAEGGRWIEVSKACKNTRLIVSRMPDTGGTRGRYALAFLNLLDGIAHARVVEAGYNPDYLNDAFVRFEKAFTEIRDSGFEDLRAVTLAWLEILAKGTATRPSLQALHQKAEAFRRSIGADPTGASGDAVPSLPWFDESRFFATLNERTD
jgi:hypothetical protein